MYMVNRRKKMGGKELGKEENSGVYGRGELELIRKAERGGKIKEGCFPSCRCS